jgi:hypothetical protein
MEDRHLNFYELWDNLGLLAGAGHGGVVGDGRTGAVDVRVR